MSSQPAPAARQGAASPRLAFALLVVVVFAFGILWTVSKLLIAHIPPIWASAGRTIVATVALFVIALATRRLVWPVRGDVPVILSIGLLHMGAFSVLINIGLQYVAVGRSAVLAYTTPLWVIPAARVFLGEQIGHRQMAGLALGLGGLLVIFNPSAFDWADRRALLGNALILLAAICWAANIVYVRAHKWITPPFELTLWQALLASVVVSAVAWVAEGVPHVEWSLEVAGLLAYAGVIGSAIAYWAMVTVNRALPAALTSLGLLGVPVVGLGFSALVLHEPMSASLIVGGLLIVLGIAAGLLPKWPVRAARKGVVSSS